MRFEPGYLFGMALQTVPEPRKVARDLFDLNLPRETLWTALGLVVVLNAALGVLAGMMFPMNPAQMGTLLSSPVLLGVIEAVFMFLLAWGIYVIGRLFGGQGTLSEAIITVVWMEFLFLMLQALTMVLSLFAPAMAAITMLASVVLFFWVLTHFIRESHGFKSTGLVFASILGFMIMAVFALSFLLVILGVEPAPMTMPH